jgi:hypothetical protein
MTPVSISKTKISRPRDYHKKRGGKKPHPNWEPTPEEIAAERDAIFAENGLEEMERRRCLVFHAPDEYEIPGLKWPEFEGSRTTFPDS